ncbi:MAG TPA: transketolase family protein [Thermodesulfovibrionia bacterium]|nr:transketolase family protein [Thermodesulfovibrionia bacterium]
MITFEELSQLSKPKATRDAYGETLAELGLEYPNIVVLDADVSVSTKTVIFAKQFPERFFNMGIAEQNMIGTAAGLSLTGKLPFASSYAVFLTGRAWEQIRQSVCYPGLNVKLVSTHSGITVGEDGASHQALEDIGIMRILPNMTVIVPSDFIETSMAIRAAAAHVGPTYVRLGRSKVSRVVPEDYKFEIGRAYVYHMGKDANIVAVGIMVAEALKAAELLRSQGIDTGVINMSTIKPIDKETLLDAAKHSGRIVTAEEHSVIGGLGSTVSECLAEHYPVRIKRIGVQDSFGRSGNPAKLMELFHLTHKDIAETIRQML